MTAQIPDESEVRTRICQQVRDLEPAAAELSDRIHGLAETGHQEYASVAALGDFLSTHGFHPSVGAFGLETALVSSAGTGEVTVALFAEYDALPEIGHGCGHNLICASSALAFIALAREVPRDGGRVVLIGSPAEENGNCKETIAQEGGLAGVDVALMAHPFSGGDYLAAPYAGLRELHIRFRGRAAHAAAAPHDGRNALDAAVQCYQSIAAARQHLAPTDKVHAIIDGGGTAVNVVPDDAGLHVQLRSSTTAGLDELSSRLEDIAAAAATATGTSRTIAWDPVPPTLPVTHNGPLLACFERHLTDQGPRQRHDTTSFSPGSTDMGNVSARVPSIHPLVSIAEEPIPIHSEDFTAMAGSESAYGAITPVAIALAMTGYEALTNESLLASARRDFNQTDAATRRTHSTAQGSPRPIGPDNAASGEK